MANKVKNLRQPSRRRTAPVVVDERYSDRFLVELDGRFRPAQVLRARYDALATDLGGLNYLSYKQRSWCRRVIHLEARIEKWELALAQGKTVSVTQYLQAVNGLIGLFKLLGLKRKARDVTLGEVLKGQVDQPS